MYYIVYRIYDTILPYSYARQETHHTLKKEKICRQYDAFVATKMDAA